MVLGAAAAATTHLRVATGIYVLPLRHPLAVARSTCTVQEIAGGRFMFGVGVGWLTGEFDALDVPFDERVDRFLEAIDVLRAAWAGGEMRHEGRHFSVIGRTGDERARPPCRSILGGNTQRRPASGRPGSATAGSRPARPRSTRPFASATSCCASDARPTTRPGAERPFHLVVRVEGRDPSRAGALRRGRVRRVTIWADHVWPPDLAPAARVTTSSPWPNRSASTAGRRP